MSRVWARWCWAVRVAGIRAVVARRVVAMSRVRARVVGVSGSVVGVGVMRSCRRVARTREAMR